MCRKSKLNFIHIWQICITYSNIRERAFQKISPAFSLSAFKRTHHYTTTYNTFGSLESCFSRTIAFLPLLLLLYLLWIIYNNMYSAREGLISRLDKTVVVLATDSITSNSIFLKALYDIRSSTCDVSLLLLLRPFANF